MSGARGAAHADLDDARALRRALGRFATGVTVVTTRWEGAPLGITANSFASVSLDPPLVLWSPAKASRRYRPFTESTSFAIHVLADHQADLARAFVSEGDVFDTLDWADHGDGTPLIDGCLARFHCTREVVHDAGDHVIVIGRVTAALHREGAPLIFSGGAFGEFTSHD